MPAHVDVETITFDGIGHLGMLISRRVVDYIVAALPAQGSPGRGAAYASVANGHRTSRNGVLTEGERQAHCADGYMSTGYLVVLQHIDGGRSDCNP